MSEQPTYRWTCGMCGDTYEATGGIAPALQIDLWRREHMASLHPGYMWPTEEPEKQEETA